MICTATVEWTFGHKWTTSFNLEFSGPVCNCIMFDFHQLAGSQLRAAHNGSYFSHTSKEGTAVMQQAWPDMASHFHWGLWSALVKVRKIKKIVWIQDTNSNTSVASCGVLRPRPQVATCGTSPEAPPRDGSKLAVRGQVSSATVKVKAWGWSDYACSTDDVVMECYGMLWTWMLWFLVSSGVTLNWSMFKLHHYDGSLFINISMWLLEKWKRITNCRGKTCSNSSALEP